MKQKLAGALVLVAALVGPVVAAPDAAESPEARAARSAAEKEPKLRPTPQGRCGPGSRPETDIQGRVPRSDHESGRAAEGYTCNTRLIGRFGRETPFGTIGGFKVERYVDGSGRECAYYDTTLLFPTNAFDQEGGVNVLDMSDPSSPVLSERLLTAAMLTPHESLVLNRKRGLLAAVAGNPSTNVGIIDIYDVSRDCRHPVLRSSTPVGLLGHESGISRDGRTFYSANPGGSLVAVDISNPDLPVTLSVRDIDSHGLSLSNDGDRAYVAGVGSGLRILDTSRVQARQPGAQMTDVARLTWESMSIPQNAIPVTIKNKPYVIEIDEFGSQDVVGAGRIIDVSNEGKPHVVSNLRLDVHQPENFERQADDPGAQIPLQGYAGHYCNVPRRRDPQIVACSMILSGLRVFDIRDPRKPREVAYFNAPIPLRSTPGFEASNWAMSSPTFAPHCREIWYTDGYSGFYAVRVTNGVWQPPGSGSGFRGGREDREEGEQRSRRRRNCRDAVESEPGGAVLPAGDVVSDILAAIERLVDGVLDELDDIEGLEDIDEVEDEIEGIVEQVVEDVRSGRVSDVEEIEEDVQDAVEDVVEEAAEDAEDDEDDDGGGGADRAVDEAVEAVEQVLGGLGR